MYQSDIQKVLSELEVHRNRILAILQRIESYTTAINEYENAVKCLENGDLESNFWGHNVKRFAYFMAVNQPLYGLILALMASMAAEETYVRPATDTADVVVKLANELKIERCFPAFHIVCCGREMFLKNYLESADAVYFVGEYSNAKVVQSRIKSTALFMFSGTGMNPFILTESGDAELAAEKAVQAALYNSGQDCGRAKVHLIHEDKVAAFLKGVKSRLKKVTCGDYTDNNVVVGSLLRDGVFMEAAEHLVKYREYIEYGGTADFAMRMISPTILKVPLSHKVIHQEFFAPVITVATYRTAGELNSYFKDNRYYNNAMYVFLFGELPVGAKLDMRSVIRNQNLMDFEQGNRAFGGYGSKANFIWDGSSPVAHPFLVSEELYKFAKKHKKRKSV